MSGISDRLVSALADRYRVEREVGAGGMATVYLAEDLRHHRPVALKVLRPELAATLGTGRFAREIEVAARLQHPNILPLLDSGEADGFFFYVMPYVEGESLRDRLGRVGELPIPDAVRILMEVADALSEAHAHGVIHRDIKPDNVMLSGRHALVTDFGVAKAVRASADQQSLTSTGVAMGTPAYMAPEQATADPHQDHRVDIYALGVLGYELLTGRAPFAGGTLQEMLAAHVAAEPQRPDQHRVTVPPALTQVIMKCLAKRPADRWQTAEEVLLNLEPFATPSGGTTPTQTRPVDALASVPPWVRFVGAAVLVGIVAFVGALMFKSKPLDITASDLVQVTADQGQEFQPAISPDGEEVAYVAGGAGSSRLVIRTTGNLSGAGEVRPAAPAGTAWYPEWSADGDRIRFLGCGAEGCADYETGKLGGAVRPSALPPGIGAEDLAWSPDDSEVAYAVAETLFVSRVDEKAKPRLVALHPGPFPRLHSLAWSPDARRIAYVDGNAGWRNIGNTSVSSIWIVDTMGGVPWRVAGGESLNVAPTWLDVGYLLFVSNRDGARGVYVVEVGRHEPRGTPRIVPGVADPHSISYAAGARKLVWAKYTKRQNIWSYPLGRASPVSIREGVPVTTGNQVIEMVDLSTDGKWLAFDSNRRGNADLYMLPVSGGTEVPLTETPGNEFGPRWSPDGTEIAFDAEILGSGGKGSSVMLMRARGGAAVALPQGSGPTGWPVWSPDGLHIAFVAWGEGQQAEVRLVSRDTVGGAWGPEVRLGACSDAPTDWAPDGSGLLCGLNSTEVCLVSVGGKVLWRSDLTGSGLVETSGGRFSRDGKEYFRVGRHRDGRAGIWAIPVAGGPARLVVSADDAGLSFLGPLSVGRGRVYATVTETESDIWVAKLSW